MAPVIWGLDLSEIKWSKFKSSYMWNSEYHLRRTKFIVYQCALIFCVVSESLGTAALSDYLDSQTLVKNLPGSDIEVHNNNYIGAASYNIFAGVFVAFIFGAAFFFDLFWPERHESKSVRIAWKACGVLASIMYLASAFTLTIITAKYCQYFTSYTDGGRVSDARGNQFLSQFKKDGGIPICYRENGRAIAAVVFSWPGALSVIGSCILLFYSINHTEKGPGPKSTHARQRDASGLEAGSDSEKEKENDSSTPVQAPASTYQPAANHGTVGTAPVAENTTQ